MKSGIYAEYVHYVHIFHIICVFSYHKSGTFFKIHSSIFEADHINFQSTEADEM